MNNVQKAFAKVLQELEKDMKGKSALTSKEIRHVFAKVQHCRDYYQAQVINNLPVEEVEE